VEARATEQEHALSEPPAQSVVPDASADFFGISEMPSQGQVGWLQNAPLPASTAGAASAAPESEGATGDASAAMDVRTEYLAGVVARLLRARRYPWRARQRRIEGVLKVSLTICADGSVDGVRVLASSGSRILDQAALEMVERASPFAPIPKALGTEEIRVSVPVAFRLHDLP